MATKYFYFQVVFCFCTVKIQNIFETKLFLGKRKQILTSTSLKFRQGSLPPGKISWRNEYQRLTHETPTHLSETLLEHSDEVLDVSFSHDGKLFCTTSKDATVKVRNIIIHLNSSNY